jgi:hypothetical protein
MSAHGIQHGSFQDDIVAAERAHIAAKEALEHAQQQNIAKKAALVSSEHALADAEEHRQSISLSKAVMEQQVAEMDDRLVVLRRQQHSLEALAHNLRLCLCDAERHLDILQNEHRAAITSANSESLLTQAIKHMLRESSNGRGSLLEK